MDDGDLKALVTKLGNIEDMPVVVDPKVLSPAEFLDAVLKKRLPNPFMPDTPQRIACDTSQKLPIRFGETIKAYRASKSLSTDDLILIPLVLAGWCRYLLGINDAGEPFELSPDPMLEEVRKMDVRDILKKKEIFAVDLFEDGLGEKILKIYEELNQGNGSVRKVLKKYVDSVLA
jgi:fructuronate reductase